MTDRELATHLWITQFPGSISLCGPTHNHHCIKSQLRLAQEVRRLMEYACLHAESHHHEGKCTSVDLALPPKDWALTSG